MIDFEKLMEENPRMKKIEGIDKIIEFAEKDLKEQIINDPDRDGWSCDQRIANASNSAMKEVYNYIYENYVKTGKTQMDVSFSPEDAQGFHYSPPYITFKVRRTAK